MKNISIIINNDNYNKYLKRIKYYKHSKKDFKFNYSKDFKYKEEFEKILKALNIKNKKERYSYIYDEVCDYLDNLFIKENMCEFHNDKCIANREKKFEKTCGCCVNNKGEFCKYFEKDHCTIKCSGCKFFVCPTLKKKKGPIKIKDIPLAYYFFNKRQVIVLRYTLFTPKEEIVNKLIKFRI